MNVRLRWMVRLEARQARLGEKVRDVVAWTVTPYLGRRADGTLIVTGERRSFPGRTRAYEYARRQMRLHYRSAAR